MKNNKQIDPPNQGPLMSEVHTCNTCLLEQPVCNFYRKSSGKPLARCKRCIGRENARTYLEKKNPKPVVGQVEFLSAQAGEFGAGEVWKPVDGWKEYEVSNYGFVRRVVAGFGSAPGRRLKRHIGNHGYLVVSLSRVETKKVDALVHRLVAETFIGNIPDGMDVCHNDGVRTNSFASNLRIDTRKGNVADRVKHGTENFGERCGTNKYSREQILAVRQMFGDGNSVTQIADGFCMPRNTVRSIVNRVTWRWL